MKEYVRPAKRIEGNLLKAKLKASPELDNLVKIGEYVGSGIRNPGHHPDVYRWDYYATRFDVQMGNRTMHIYGLVNIANTEMGDVKLLDITQLEETTDPGKASFDAYKARHGSQISGNNVKVSQDYGTVNRQYTADDIIRDRDYREAVKRGDTVAAGRLVKEAAKAAGMATDEKGKLIDLYHGTPRHGFTEFDTDVIFTTTSESVASGYANIAPVRGTPTASFKSFDLNKAKGAKAVFLSDPGTASNYASTTYKGLSTKLIGKEIETIQDALNEIGRINDCMNQPKRLPTR